METLAWKKTTSLWVMMKSPLGWAQCPAPLRWGERGWGTWGRGVVGQSPLLRWCSAVCRGPGSFPPGSVGQKEPLRLDQTFPLEIGLGVVAASLLHPCYVCSCSGVGVVTAIGNGALSVRWMKGLGVLRGLLRFWCLSGSWHPLCVLFSQISPVTTEPLELCPALSFVPHPSVPWLCSPCATPGSSPRFAPIPPLTRNHSFSSRAPARISVPSLPSFSWHAVTAYLELQSRLRKHFFSPSEKKKI